MLAVPLSCIADEMLMTRIAPWKPFPAWPRLRYRIENAD